VLRRAHRGRGGGRCSVVDPVRIAAFGTFISATTLILTLGLRWWDSRSRIKIECRLGNDVPRVWWQVSGTVGGSDHETLLWVWVENRGTRTESLSDAYLAVPGAEDLRPFSGGQPTMPSSLEPGFPRVFNQTLQGVSRELVNRGCTGTARVELVIQLGRGKLHKKRIEIPDVEARAQGREPK
jgi:hypothetical protein